MILYGPIVPEIKKNILFYSITSSQIIVKMFFSGSTQQLTLCERICVFIKYVVNYINVGHAWKHCLQSSLLNLFNIF